MSAQDCSAATGGHESEEAGNSPTGETQIQGFRRHLRKSMQMFHMFF